jgi:hypothetical protein
MSKGAKQTAMTNRSRSLAGFVALIATFAVAGCEASWGTSASSAPPESESGTGASRPVPSGDGVVVLELFTSQGCSSCPPADEVLSDLGREPKLKGKVVPLAYHVDYWNYIGWSDPFSSPSFTERQGAYNAALGKDGLYTPELVVQGASHMVGSDRGNADRAIESALADAMANRVTLEPVHLEGGRISSKASATLSSDPKAGQLDLYAVVFENGLVTSVKRGENGGRTLTNDFVVRKFVKLASLDVKAGATHDAELSVAADPAWKAENVGVALLLQDPATMRIHGAAVRGIEH